MNQALLAATSNTVNYIIAARKLVGFRAAIRQEKEVIYFKTSSMFQSLRRMAMSAISTLNYQRPLKRSLFSKRRRYFITFLRFLLKC